jgi:hypothetical protein
MKLAQCGSWPIVPYFSCLAAYQEAHCQAQSQTRRVRASGPPAATNQQYSKDSYEAARITGAMGRRLLLLLCTWRCSTYNGLEGSVDLQGTLWCVDNGLKHPDVPCVVGLLQVNTPEQCLTYHNCMKFVEISSLHCLLVLGAPLLQPQQQHLSPHTGCTYLLELEVDHCVCEVTEGGVAHAAEHLCRRRHLLAAHPGVRICSQSSTLSLHPNLPALSVAWVARLHPLTYQ